jgi:hypothetical protein
MAIPARADVVGVLIGCGVLAWRATVDPAGLWHDWPAIAALYWIVVVRSASPRAERLLTPAVMTYLLVLFARGHLPAVWRSYGWMP